MRCRAPLAAAAAMLAFAAPAPAAETGVNETLAQTVSTAEKAPRLGADWVRIWALWQDLQPAPGQYTQHLVDDLNRRVGALKARGIKVLVVIHRSPAWAGGGTTPPDPDSHEFGAGAPDPAGYAAVVRAAYPAIKAVQPNDAVVLGGLVGNHFAFLEQLYANGAGGAFDAVAVHTDTACLTNGPDVY